MDEQHASDSGTSAARSSREGLRWERDSPRPDQIQIDGKPYPRPVGLAGKDSSGGIVQRPDGLHVPLVEERLTVTRQPVQTGEARIRRRVVEEEETLPVEVWREELVVERQAVEPRQLSPDEAATFFREATLRIPLLGEEPVARKRAYVTGEVVVNRRAHTERRQVRGIVRSQQVTVDVDEDYERARQDFRDHYFGYQWGDDPRSFEEVEPHYRWGWEVGRAAYYADRSFEEVEPALRQEYRRAGYTSAEWDELREEIRAGWERARG